MSLGDLFQTPAPDVALEIDHTHVAAAKLAWRGGQAVIAAHASEALAAGLVTPGLSALNITDVPVLSLLKLEKVPPRASELQEIVRWQVRKTAPFPIEQAVLSIAPGARAADGASEFVVALSRADVIHQYEQACLMAGAHAGLVDLSTFGVINGVLAGASAPGGDWLLVHVTETYLTLAVMRDRALLFFRNRSEEAEGSLADLIHQTAMYYEDRLNGGGFARVMIAGGAQLPGGAESVRRGLEERLGVSVDAVDPRVAAALQDRIGASPDLLDMLAPLVGMLVRERKVA
jgi:hypothetical protein